MKTILLEDRHLRLPQVHFSSMPAKLVKIKKRGLNPKSRQIPVPLPSQEESSGLKKLMQLPENKTEADTVGNQWNKLLQEQRSLEAKQEAADRKALSQPADKKYKRKSSQSHPHHPFHKKQKHTFKVSST